MTQLEFTDAAATASATLRIAIESILLKQLASPSPAVRLGSAIVLLELATAFDSRGRRCLSEPALATLARVIRLFIRGASTKFERQTYRGMMRTLRESRPGIQTALLPSLN